MARRDRLIALVFALYALGQSLGVRDIGGPPVVNALLFTVAAASLAWRRTNPLASVAGVSGGLALQAALTDHPPEGLIASGPGLIGAFSVAAHGTRRQALAGLALLAAAIVVMTLHDPQIWSARDVDDASWWWLVLLISWLGGLYVDRRRHTRELLAATEQLKADRDDAVQRERERMARLPRRGVPRRKRHRIAGRCRTGVAGRRSGAHARAPRCDRADRA